MTDWRKTGQISYDKWAEVLEDYDSPIRYEGRVAHSAAKERSGECLEALRRETMFGTEFRDGNKEENCNALNLQPSTSGSYLAFSSWTQGIRVWYSRISKEQDQ